MFNTHEERRCFALEMALKHVGGREDPVFMAANIEKYLRDGYPKEDKVSTVEERKDTYVNYEALGLDGDEPETLGDILQSLLEENDKKNAASFPAEEYRNPGHPSYSEEEVAKALSQVETPFKEFYDFCECDGCAKVQKQLEANRRKDDPSFVYADFSEIEKRILSQYPEPFKTGRVYMQIPYQFGKTDGASVFNDILYNEGL